MTPSPLPRSAGLEAGSDRLTLYVHSPDTVKQLLLPPSFMRRFPNLQIRTDLVDMQVGGVFSIKCGWFWGVFCASRMGFAL